MPFRPNWTSTGLSTVAPSSGEMMYAVAAAGAGFRAAGGAAGAGAATVLAAGAAGGGVGSSRPQAASKPQNNTNPHVRMAASLATDARDSSTGPTAAWPP